MTTPNLVFVNYLSRSGSTLLCTLLDEYEGITVGIEGGFPGFDSNLMPTDMPIIHNNADLDRYLSSLFSDIRFSEWKLEINSVKKALLDIGYPLRFRDILITCLKMHLGLDSKYWIHKSGFYLECVNQARSEFPGAKHLYIQRDPRAIYSSQKNATSLYNSKPMAISLVAFAMRYQKRASTLAVQAGSPDILEIRYEDLVTNKEQTIQTVLNFLGAAGLRRKTESNYKDKIPENQLSLHENINKSPMESGLDKWKSTLSPLETRFLEASLCNELELNGYEITHPPLTLKQHGQYLALRLRLLSSKLKKLILQ